MNTALHCKRMVGGIRRDIVNEGRYANSRGKPNGFDAAVFGTPGETRTHYIPLRSLAFLLVRYTHHNFPLFLIRYGIVWLLVNLHKNP